MNLELDILHIKDVKFGEKTTVSKGILYINKRELIELLEEDRRLSEVDIELAHPGESCRLVQVFDVTEPRAKIIGENFPGILGKIKTVGEGRTRVLRGSAVVTIDCTAEERGSVIDMSGIGADMGIYAKLQNVALICKSTLDIKLHEYKHALRIAGLKAAVYLAGRTLDIPTDELETYSLGALSEICREMDQLPRVAYIYQVHALQQGVVQIEPIFYGDNTVKLLPTIVHPNEILDGALVRNYWTKGHETYSIQNHPVIRELYKRHGKELCFVGVIITVAGTTEAERERSAILAAKLAKTVLEADGVILTKTGGGAPHIDMSQTCQICEELGVKTALIVQDQSTGENSEDSLLVSTPLADAIVNIGSYNKLITLPSVERVIGKPVTSPTSKSTREEIIIPTPFICGTVNQIGASRLIMIEL